MSPVIFDDYQKIVIGDYLVRCYDIGNALKMAKLQAPDFIGSVRLKTGPTGSDLPPIQPCEISVKTNIFVLPFV